MVSELQLGDLRVAVVRKKIRNLHLSVHPPDGHVKISAPVRLSPEAIRLFAISKIGWIRKQRTKILSQERETPREYKELETHWAWGGRCRLHVVVENRAPSVALDHDTLILRVRPGTDARHRQAVVEDWYRSQTREAAAPLIAKWEAALGVKVEKVFVQKMKTLWGSCNSRRHTVRLNSELAKKPRECLEYIVVHELAHLLERSHGPRFVALMDRHLPNWRYFKARLNRLPVRHEDWLY